MAADGKRFNPVLLMLWIGVVFPLVAAACSRDRNDETAGVTVVPLPGQVLATPTPTITSPASSTPFVSSGGGGRSRSGTAAPTATPTATPDPAANEPVGFPVDPTLRPLQVLETPLGKVLAPPSPTGPTVVEVARDYQTRPANDAEANRYGWNCRVHTKHEGAPGVDWYLPAGTPVLATMRGQAELYIVSTANSFAYYGVDPRLTLGLPAPTTPLYPLPGPSGGLGVFVSILNGNLRAEYGHLDLDLTLALVPEEAFIAPFSKGFNYRARFSRPLPPDQVTLIATWPVEKGEVIGYVGNTGYSDVPHLHYQVVTRDRRTKFCPTREPFPGSGWLFGRPDTFR